MSNSTNGIAIRTKQVVPNDLVAEDTSYWSLSFSATSLSL